MSTQAVVIEKDGQVVEVYFDLTIIIDKSNKVITVDNSQNDWKDFVDCDTLVTHRVKINVG